MKKNTCSCGAAIALVNKRCRPCHNAFLRQRPLSPMQAAVFASFLRGEGQKIAASDLGLNVKSVATHKLQLMRRLGVANDVELVLAGVRLGHIAGYHAEAPDMKRCTHGALLMLGCVFCDGSH